VGLDRLGLDANKFGLTVRANDRKKFYWDIVVLIFAIFNSLFIPLSLSFEQIEEDLNSIPFYVFLDNAANIFFILDIIVQMNTTYYDSDGEEVFSKSRIRKNYICGMFPIDLLSSLPFDLISPPLPS